ncbi:MAG: hypothetical protein Kow0079_11260 [Vicingaceae bacterium]
MVAQKLHYELPDNANKMYENGNYLKAVELYRELYKNHPSNTKYKFRYGVSMLYAFNYDEALNILEQACKKTDAPEDKYFHLAKAYHLTNRYEQAINYYKKYINGGNNDKLKEEAERSIEMCEYAKVLTKNPLKVTFENLGQKINSAGKDYLPFITPDESFLFFTTRREGTTGRIYDLEGYYTADIYTTKYKYGKWSRVRSVGYPNSYGNEQTAGISEDGSVMFFYVDNPKDKNNLKQSEFQKTSFRKANKIDEKFINEKSSKQIAATMSADKNVLIFASNRSGGKGGFDLYRCKKLPNGKWGKPQIIKELSTNHDELYPYLTDEGKTLYFSSNGFMTIGGFDLFESHYDEVNDKWLAPKNLGYPINTPNDNFSICFTANKKYAYVADYRKDSYGDLDLYRVNFEFKEPDYTTVKGFVLKEDSTIFNQRLEIQVFNATTGDLQGVYESKAKDGSFIMILPPDEYEINISIPEKGRFKQKLIIKGRKDYKKELNKNITVTFDAEESEPTLK